jgi:hypothetical protein
VREKQSSEKRVDEASAVVIGNLARSPILAILFAERSEDVASPAEESKGRATTIHGQKDLLPPCSLSAGELPEQDSSYHGVGAVARSRIFFLRSGH